MWKSHFLLHGSRKCWAYMNCGVRGSSALMAITQPDQQQRMWPSSPRASLQSNPGAGRKVVFHTSQFSSAPKQNQTFAFFPPENISTRYLLMCHHVQRQFIQTASSCNFELPLGETLNHVHGSFIVSHCCREAASEAGITICSSVGLSAAHRQTEGRCPVLAGRRSFKLMFQAAWTEMDWLWDFSV